MSIRLVQLRHPVHGRRVASVEEPSLALIREYRSCFELAQTAISTRRTLADLMRDRMTPEKLDYDSIYSGESDWSLLPAFDHPHEPARCLITGTGLTHKASADNRQSMHDASNRATVESDSMKMYRIGLEGGRPEPGTIGAEPEWFYKGTGHVLRAQGQPLDVPAHGDDGGEEAEITGAYVIGPDQKPYRVGLVQANEFSDHVLEAKNYLYLASSKLRSCAIGPELIIDADFSDVHGNAWIERAGAKVWEAEQHSGERWMSHTLANLEHHHFKHASHRIAGEAHLHFFGADNFSFRQRLKLEDGDEMVIQFEGFGRALRNPIRIESGETTLVTVAPL